MLTLISGIKLSALIDKLDLKITNPEESAEKIGYNLLEQITKKAHTAESEILDFVASVKKCSIEEAGEVELIELIKGLTKESGFMDFFKSAVKSQDRE
jgi:hypothetical protein